MNLFLIHGLNRLSRIENIFFIRRLMSTRHRRERSNRRKNLTSPGKEAGALEWVCKFESETKSKASGTKKGHNDRYYQNLNYVYCS